MVTKLASNIWLQRENRPALPVLRVIHHVKQLQNVAKKRWTTPTDTVLEPVTPNIK